MTIDLLGCGRLVEAAISDGEVIESRKIFKIAAITAEQNFAQIDQTVNRLLDGIQFAGGVSIPVFHVMSHTAAMLISILFVLAGN